MRYFERAFSLNPFQTGRLENYNLVLEALEERESLLNNAPHINTTIPIIVPCSNIFMAVYYYVTPRRSPR